MGSHAALTAVLGVVLALGLTGCGDDCSTDCFATSSPTPTITPIATPRPPPGEPFSCVVANCGPDVTCESLGFVDPVKHCYLYDGQYLCCHQSPFE